VGNESEIKVLGKLYLRNMENDVFWFRLVWKMKGMCKNVYVLKVYDYGECHTHAEMF
jgi:hypothetical protein